MLTIVPAVARVVDTDPVIGSESWGQYTVSYVGAFISHATKCKNTYFKRIVLQGY